MLTNVTALKLRNTEAYRVLVEQSSLPTKTSLIRVAVSAE